MNQRKKMTHKEWMAEGVRRFGDDPMKWAFVCPCCRHRATLQDWKDAGASDSEAAFSCVGRHTGAKRGAFEGKGSGPCNYAGGGLFRLNPVDVVFVDEGKEVVVAVFDFADDVAVDGAREAA